MEGETVYKILKGQGIDAEANVYLSVISVKNVTHPETPVCQESVFSVLRLLGSSKCSKWGTLRLRP